MKDTISKQLAAIWAEVTYGFRFLCLKPSPMKRLIMVLALGCILAIANLYLVFNSLSRIGQGAGGKDFLELEHVKSLELQYKKDSINPLKQEMYE